MEYEIEKKGLATNGRSIYRLIDNAIDYIENKRLDEVHQRFENARLWASEYFMYAFNGKQLKSDKLSKYKMFKLQGHFMIEGQSPTWIKILAKKIMDTGI